MAESEASTDCSSPRQYTEEETDQQLLQWAGRLELESIDLREKSSDLLRALEANSRKLQDSYEKINTASGWLKNAKGKLNYDTPELRATVILTLV